MNKSILVTALGGIGGEIAKCLRLADTQFTLIGGDCNERCLNKDCVDIFILLRTGNDDNYLIELRRFINEFYIGLVFPGSLSEMIVLIRERERLLREGVFVVADDWKLFDLCNNKMKLFSYLKTKKINVPHFFYCSEVEQIRELNKFPVVIKPNKNSYSSNDVMIAFDYEELECIMRLFNHRNIEYIIQEWKGDSKSEYTISVTCNEQFEPIGAIAMRRITDSSFMIKNKSNRNGNKYIISSGVSSVMVDEKESLLQQVKHIAGVLHCRSSINLQGIWEDDLFWLIDAHPALTGSVYARALAGYNEPAYYVDKYLGKYTTIQLKVKPCAIMRKVVSERFDA